MTARSIVRDLRDSGELQVPRASVRARRRSVVMLIVLLAFVGVAAFAAVQNGPALLKLVEKKPPPVSYMKPQA
ncbi:MAG: hypothetical protein ABIQ30_02370 [Devosia sp.]